MYTVMTSVQRIGMEIWSPQLLFSRKNLQRGQANVLFHFHYYVQYKILFKEARRYKIFRKN